MLCGMAVERRPIAARRLPVFIAMSRWLARASVSPNAISVIGMVACVLAGGCFWATATQTLGEWHRWLFVLGASLVQLRLLCNMLDGMVAIEGGRTSAVGELYNEIPDRVSDIATLVGFGYALHSSVELGLLSAVLAVLTAYVRAAGKVAGAPQDYRGPMAKQQRMFTITVTSVFLALAPETWRSVGPIAGVGTVGLASLALGVICVGCVVTCVRRVLGAASALRCAGASNA